MATVPRRTTGSTSDARPTRDIILDASERRFAEKGFAGVSVREIATDAGLKNQASLYHHFKNKRTLYEAVLARGLEPAVAILAERAAMAGSTDPRTPLGRFVEDVFIDRIVDYLAQHPYLPRLIQRAGLDDGRYLRTTLTRLVRPLLTQGQTILEMTEGSWNAQEVPHLAAGLYLMIFGYFANAGLLEILIPEGPLAPAAIERQRKFLRRAVVRLLSDAPTPAAPAARKSSR